MSDHDAIDSFTKENNFLSNFFASRIEWKERVWPTVEHVFQAEKAVLDAEKDLIHAATSPTKAKRLGRKVHRQPDWADIKAGVMHDVVKEKFSQNTYLAQQLLDTGVAELIEGNRWHDNEWGDCMCDQCADIKGENLLGQILMRVRDELRAQQ